MVTAIDVLPCRSCRRPAAEHLEGKCLFGAGHFDRAPSLEAAEDWELRTAYVVASRLPAVQTPTVFKIWDEIRAACKHPYAEPVIIGMGNQLGEQCATCGVTL